MGIKSKNPKKPWIRGKDMPDFSGTSWKDLNDIWPIDSKINSDPWKILGLFMPAFVVTQQFMKTILNGETIGYRDFIILCWMMRVQESKNDIAFEAWATMKGMNISGTIWYARKAKLTQLGLIENLPVTSIRIYRITGTGRLIVKYFVDQLTQANDNLGYWISLQDPKMSEKINKTLCKYCPGWNDLN